MLNAAQYIQASMYSMLNAFLLAVFSMQMLNAKSIVCVVGGRHYSAPSVWLIILHKVHLPFRGHGRGHRLALQNRAAARQTQLTVNLRGQAKVPSGPAYRR